MPAVTYAVTLARTRRFVTPLGTVSLHHVQPAFFFGYEDVARRGAPRHGGEGARRLPVPHARAVQALSRPPRVEWPKTFRPGVRPGSSTASSPPPGAGPSPGSSRSCCARDGNAERSVVALGRDRHRVQARCLRQSVGLRTGRRARRPAPGSARRRRSARSRRPTRVVQVEPAIPDLQREAVGELVPHGREDLPREVGTPPRSRRSRCRAAPARGASPGVRRVRPTSGSTQVLSWLDVDSRASLNSRLPCSVFTRIPSVHVGGRPQAGAGP